MIPMFTKKSQAAIKLMGQAFNDKPENVGVKYKLILASQKCFPVNSMHSF